MTSGILAEEFDLLWESLGAANNASRSAYVQLHLAYPFVVYLIDYVKVLDAAFECFSVCLIPANGRSD